MRHLDLGTGQPLKTEDDVKALAGRYLFRATGDWFIGAQGSAANYQVLGATAEDGLVLETLGVRAPALRTAQPARCFAGTVARVRH
jgi:hypothetical protein